MGNNKEIKLSIKQLSGIIISVLISALFIGFIIYMIITHLLNADDKIIAIVGALGNISGGVIGGLVAFIVAKTQISSTIKNEEIALNYNVISHLKLLKSEFNYNKNLIIEFKDDIINQQNLEIVEQLSTVSWSNSSPQISSKLSDDDLISILNTVTTTNLLKVHMKGSRFENIETELENLCDFLDQTIILLDRNINELTLQD